MQVAQALAALLLLVGFARWVPGRPRTGQGMGRFWKYGGNLMGSQVLAFAGSNVDSLVIGRRLGADALGIYDRAYRLLMVPLAQIKMPATTVALPVLSRLQADRDRYDEYLCRAQLVLGYSVMPALAVVVGASGPLTDVLLGPQWTQSAPILALLAVAGGLNTIAFVAYWVYLSRSLTHRLLQYTAVSAAVKVLFIVVGSNWGLIGVAAGAAAAPAVLWLVSYWWLSRLTDLPLRRLVSGAVRILIGAGLAALAAAAAVSAVQDVAGAVVQIGCAALAVAGGYLVLTVLFRAYRRDVADVREVAVMMVSRKRHVG